ncbi:hypothetical protein HDU97_003740 [Phlyctochytrium planicorne]|nr:hypothetical protein HDU97_003740 [Phlyctochytrium planicorne]
MEWDHTGQRLITGDEVRTGNLRISLAKEGELVVWKVDAKGRMTSICQYRLKGPAQWCVIRKPSRTRQTSQCLSFFSGTSTGRIYFADDMGRCSESGFVTSPACNVRLMESEEALAIISEDLTLMLYSISSEGKLGVDIEVTLRPTQTKFRQLKLSTPAQKTSGTCLAWIEDQSLAMTCTTGIKVVDIRNEEITMLQLPDVASCKLICTISVASKFFKIFQHNLAIIAEGSLSIYSSTGTLKCTIDHIAKAETISSLAYTNGIVAIATTTVELMLKTWY